jgi:outer membrane protein OmpA-like peptidoglycan-associated protein
MSHQDDGSAAFIDLMTSLAVVFILLVVCLLNEKDAKIFLASAPAPEVVLAPPLEIQDTAMMTAKKTREDVLQQLRSAFRTDGLEVEADPTDIWTLVVVIRQHQLSFETKKFALNREGKQTVDKVFGTIEPIVCEQYRNHIDWVIVEGHTDKEGNTTLSGQIDNIDLSSRRATSVVHYALRSLNSRKKDLQCIRSLISPRGMGSAHPRSGGARRQMRKDRRVEVKIHVVAPPPQTVETVDNLPEASDALTKPL